MLVYAAGIHRRGGPVSHLQRLLTSISKGETHHRRTFIVNSDLLLPPSLDRAIAITLLRVRRPHDWLYQDFWPPRAEVRHSGADILVNLADFGPLPRGRPVATFQRNPNTNDSGPA